MLRVRLLTGKKKPARRQRCLRAGVWKGLMQVRRSGLTLHLSEHYGDATPGSTVFVPMQDIDALQRELAAKDYAYARPGIETLGWGSNCR